MGEFHLSGFYVPHYWRFPKIMAKVEGRPYGYSVLCHGFRGQCTGVARPTKGTLKSTPVERSHGDIRQFCERLRSPLSFRSLTLSSENTWMYCIMTYHHTPGASREPFQIKANPVRTNFLAILRRTLGAVRGIFREAWRSRSTISVAEDQSHMTSDSAHRICP